MPSTIISTKTIALDSLVSLLFIFMFYVASPLVILLINSSPTTVSKQSNHTVIFCDHHHHILMKNNPWLSASFHTISTSNSVVKILHNFWWSYTNKEVQAKLVYYSYHHFILRYAMYKHACKNSPVGSRSFSNWRKTIHSWATIPAGKGLPCSDSWILCRSTDSTRKHEENMHSKFLLACDKMSLMTIDCLCLMSQVITAFHAGRINSTLF